MQRRARDKIHALFRTRPSNIACSRLAHALSQICSPTRPHLEPRGRWDLTLTMALTLHLEPRARRALNGQKDAVPEDGEQHAALKDARLDKGDRCGVGQ